MPTLTLILSLRERKIPSHSRGGLGWGWGKGGRYMAFPKTRLRRMRATETHRRMVRETTVAIDDLIYPLFVTHGRNIRREINSMPGCFQLSVDLVTAEAKEISVLGIPAVILFGIPAHKDETGTEAYSANGVVQQAIKAIKDSVQELL